MNCGNVGEFRAATIERILRGLNGDIPGDVVGHRIELYITCNRCLAKKVRLEDPSNPMD